MNLRAFFILPLSVLLAGCGTTKKTAKAPATVQMADVEIKTPRAPKPYQPTPTKFWDILHTNLAVRFAIAAREIMGTAVVRIKPYAGVQDSLFLYAKDMEFSAVMAVQKGQPQTVRFEKREGGIVLRFSKKFLPADTLELTLVYTGMPYKQAAAGGHAIVEERGLYFVNAAGRIPGKPLQIWTQGETESNSHWFPTIDAPGEKFTMELAIQVPDSLTTISNGVLFKSEKAAGGQRTDYWKMEQPVQAYAFMMAIGVFTKIEDTPFEGKPIVYYLEPQYAPYAKAIFSNTPKMVQFFSDYTGVKYPWPKYSQVAVRDYVSGAMENTSASLFGEFVNGTARERADNSVEGVVAHELYHQWFGDYVTAESWNNLTLNESFATDGEILWLNFHNGKRAADAQRYNYLQRYLGGAKRNDAPLVRNFWNGPDEIFDHISYQKGGQILYSIRQLAGEELFKKALTIYLQKHAYGTAEAADWRMALEEATGTDWTAFFEQWYYRGGHPKVQFSYLYDDVRRQVQVVARQPADSVFNLPITIGVYSNPPILDLPTGESAVLKPQGAAKNLLRWVLNTPTDTLAIPYAGSERPLIIPDVEHVIVGSVKEEKSDTAWTVQMRLATDHISQRRAIIATSENKFSADLAATRLQILQANDPSLQELMYAVLTPEKDTSWHTYPGYLQVAEAHFKDARQPAGVRAAALRLWGKWQTKETVAALAPAYIYDSSYRVGSAALNALVAVDSAAGTAAATVVLHQGNARGALLETALITEAVSGNSAGFDLLLKGSDAVWGAGKAPYLDAMNAVFIHTKDEITAGKAVQKLVQWYSEEEATFVRRRQLSNLEELVVEAQKEAQSKLPAAIARRQTLLAALATLATSETDPELVATLKSMQTRIQEATAPPAKPGAKK